MKYLLMTRPDRDALWQSLDAMPGFLAARFAPLSAEEARERDYRARSLPQGIEEFRQARAANLALLRSLDAAQWLRAGTQEGVGRVALCDIPHMMAEHDESHRAEIDAGRGHAG